MSDASELLLLLFEHIRDSGPPSAAAAVDACFGLRVSEAVQCPACGQVTQELRYLQYQFIVAATALRGSLRAAAFAGPDPGLGARLRRLEDEQLKSCDIDAGAIGGVGCGGCA